MRPPPTPRLSVFSCMVMAFVFGTGVEKKSSNYFSMYLMIDTAYRTLYLRCGKRESLLELGG